MKFTTTSIFLSTSALAVAASAAPSTGTTYQLKVTNSKNPSINNSFLALKDPYGSFLNALGVWSTGPVRYSYQVTLSTSKSDSRLYEVKSGLESTQLVLRGLREAMGLFDAPVGALISVGEGEGFYNDKFTFLKDSVLLRHGQDFNTSGTDIPSGGAGSWRACKVNNGVDYQMYWYDGSSPLPIKDCEGVSLELVASTPQLISTGAATATGTTGPFITGVPAPTITSPHLTGVPSPSVTGASNVSGTGVSPKQPTYTGAGSQVGVKGAFVGMAFGALILAA